MNYKVYQGSELKQTVTSKTAVMNGLQPNRTYEFGVQPNDGNRDGTKVATSVTTRGIRFNIPKTLMVGSTITLRYEEYPLGIVPIGTEPSGMFGGGNKQNLSAKVISMSNGSSVVEVAGNVIDVGGRNLAPDTDSDWVKVASGGWGTSNMSTPIYEVKDGQTYTASFEIKNQTNNVRLEFFSMTAAGARNGQITEGYFIGTGSSGIVSHTFTANLPDNTSYVLPDLAFTQALNTVGSYEYRRFKFEHDTATPYASFVDGDTFTVQPDGICALFSEYKALYY